MTEVATPPPPLRDAAKELLSPEFLRRIEQLQLVSRKVLMGRLRGERRSKAKGTSIEFADHREYTRGDDIRHIDWNTYARLEKLFLKLFVEEQELTLHLVIDASRSMALGEPNKLLHAKRTAAALGYIALVNSDRVGIHAMRGGQLATFAPARGRARTWAMLRFLTELEGNGTTDLAASCRTFALRQQTRGVVVLLSDLLDPHGFEGALKWFLHRNHEVYVLHLFGEDELNPRIGGHLELVDSETGDRTEVTINRPLLRRYREMLDALCTAARDWCNAHGMVYTVTSTATDFDQLVLSHLRRRGLLR
ncbi:MAG: DUF58 domain-containing protein [Candidatus Sumerlaeia bacterium]|nr:DUF58 domain-containing protein [Candidatus Sumerlaeia bacterium]